MLFGKKKKEEPVSVDEIKKMANSGMSDRDIIKDLKNRGFSYKEIEKAMLSAVKDNVTEPRFSQQEEFYAPPAPAPPQFGPDFQEQPSFGEPETMPENDLELDAEGGQAILEELVEGVIEEKWHKFEDRVANIENTFEKIHSEIRNFEVRIEQQKQSSPLRELDARFSDLSQQLDDLDARVGGLEKAFKQFLPALTKNIESLSQLIHEIKEKHPMMEEEV